MSSARVKKISGIEKAPYVGALLRLAHREVRARLLQALAERGLGEINEAYFSLFQYPPVDGMQPAALAKHLGISKQALNHLLGQLEKLGYLERKRERGYRHTTIRLTERGWHVVESNVSTMNQIEEDWQRQLGKQRFADLKAALRELSGIR